YDDIVKITAEVIKSVKTFQQHMDYITPADFTIGNAVSLEKDGVFVPDLFPILKAMNDTYGPILQKIKEIIEQIENIIDELNNMKNQINNNTTNINKNTNAIQKILDNLYQAGAITNKNIENYVFVDGVGIANGDVN